MGEAGDILELSELNSRADRSYRFCPAYLVPLNSDTFKLLYSTSLPLYLHYLPFPSASAAVALPKRRMALLLFS